MPRIYPQANTTRPTRIAVVCLFAGAVWTAAGAGCSGAAQPSDPAALEPAAVTDAPTTPAEATTTSAVAPSPTPTQPATGGSGTTPPKTPPALVVPALSATSPEVEASTAGGSSVSVSYVVFQDSAASASSGLTGTNKQFEITALDYDPCPFYYAHAQTSAGVYNYKVAPKASFNFAGIYLVNGSPGAALSTGTYTVGATSGLQVVTDSRTSGINFSVTSCRIGNFQGFSSGTVTVDQLSTDNKHTPVSGRIELTTTDGGHLSGSFTVGHCTSGNTAYPVAPNPDPDACTL